MPRSIHGNQAAACNAFGNLKSSVTFRLKEVIKTVVIATLKLILKVLRYKKRPTLKIEIADIV